jgi:hypothetical protein
VREKPAYVACDDCGEVYDEACGDGYCGLCPACADASEPANDDGGACPCLAGFVTLPRAAAEQAARALCARACLDALGVPLSTGHQDYCLVPLIGTAAKPDPGVSP